MPEYGAALRNYERATAIDPEYVFAWSNQADVHTSIAGYDYAIGRDPRPAVERARSAGERCLAVDPNFYSVLDTLAQSQLALAHYLIDTSGDPSEGLARARGYLDRADAVHPGHWVTWYFRLVAASAEAQLVLRQGADPARSIAVARGVLHEVLQRAAENYRPHVEAARIDLVEAAWAAHAGHGSAALWARARADAERAIALDEHSADARLVAAEVHLHMAAARRSRAEADLGISYLDPLLARNPHLAKAQSMRTALVRLRDSM
jgi:serine/threonine-protein kinase